MQKKVLLIVKSNTEPGPEGPFPNGIENDIVFMELNRPILENMYNTSTVSDQFSLTPLFRQIKV